MTLAQAIDTLDNTDFGKADLEPDAIQAISILLNAARTRMRGLEPTDAPNRQIDTVTD